MENNEYDDSYKKAVDNLHHQETLLFERLNYFLAGSAFLITAYAALAVTVKYQSYNAILLLTYLVNVAGLYLSIFFASVNYLNTRILGEIYWLIINLESPQDGSSPKDLDKLKKGQFYNYQLERVRDIERKLFHKGSPDFLWQLFCRPFIGLGTFLKSAITQTDKDPATKNRIEIKNAEAPYTFLLPLGLVGFWVTVFIFFFFWHHYRPYLVFCLFAPLLLIFVPYIIDYRYTGRKIKQFICSLARNKKGRKTNKNA